MVCPNRAFDSALQAVAAAPSRRAEMMTSRITEYSSLFDRPITGTNGSAQPPRRRAFTLVELLLVIAVISLLIALLIPALRIAREQGHRTVCLSNHRQLTLAWIAYATEHDSKLVCGKAFGYQIRSPGGSRKTVDIRGWAGSDLSPLQPVPPTGPDKGALWSWIRNRDIYRCRRGRPGHLVTYAMVVAANGVRVQGTWMGGTGGLDLTSTGKRVGSTVLRLTKMTDIVSPGAAQRAVFIDTGQTPTSNDFYVHYLYPQWKGYSSPPVRHGDGTTLSMADGHAEYWKWKGRETVEMPRMVAPMRGLYAELLEGAKDYESRTEDGMYDLQRLQRATWGRLGYKLEGKP